MMVKAVINNDVFSVFHQKFAYIGVLLLLSIGYFVGFQFKISLGKHLAINAPYNLGYIIGLLSLLLIFIATILVFLVLFKEKDANFGFIVFTTPVRKKAFAFSRFFSFYTLTVLAFLTISTGFTIGLQIKLAHTENSGFYLWHFVYPFIVFGCLNALLVCSLLFWVAQKFQNKLLVALCGLTLYILYMIIMLFSNAPFMAQALPQSLLAQKISAFTDPFGLSAYFMESKDLTIAQRSTMVVPFTHYFAINRLLYLTFSFIGIYFSCRTFSFVPKSTRKNKVSRKMRRAVLSHIHSSFTPINPIFSIKSTWQSIGSFFKIDTLYLFKSTALIVVSVLLLFYLGIELYSDIDMGIRFPENYASSGLLAQTINGIFYPVGALVLVYFVNDTYWCSEASGFSIIQDTTYYSNQKLIGHFGSLTLLVTFLTVLLLAEAILFQFIYNYPVFDWNAYWGVIVYNTFPLLLLLGFLLFINNLATTKTLALVISILFFFFFATPISNYILHNSLFRFLSGYLGTYSDFIGYGPYLPVFGLRLIFGFSMLSVLFITHFLIQHTGKKWIGLLLLSLMLCIGLVSSKSYLNGYNLQDKETLLSEMANYEKLYRKFETIPQPTIKNVITEIDLFPEKKSYTIKGQYLIKNLHAVPLDSLLISIPKDFEIQSMIFQTKNRTLRLKNSDNLLILEQPIQPNDSTQLSFTLHYQWLPVNGHQPFNAIIDNGSFMRISQYFPFFGYDADREIKDEDTRKKYGLGKVTDIKPLEAERTYIDTFIDLKMQISVDDSQIAIGTGMLHKKWHENGRSYVQYEAENIPFRFALSSAGYSVKKAMYKGVSIEVYYNPLHDQNVDELIKNTMLTLAYCNKNFGLYPFDSIVFAEISSFSQGFNGTAYPGVVFMTENMAFHAHVKAGDNQDVINELAGHEVAHFWWGNNQIAPDYREGYAMLTESLAMYTEMMIYKQMHGNDKMIERLAVQKQIYEAQKGFHAPTPLIKATKKHTDIAYNKGAIVFVELSQLIGENTLNLALKNFLNNFKYPNSKPISTDLLEEILKISDVKYHQQINDLFWKP
ncbi:M1 family aminopeptidase [Aquimarina hainanensis]|uniref:M1 family aminopeptidase n=1 Tax=Aquimarina hainanensis TaxID=1578017 RepID=A0ABW5N4X6_9FLAO